MKILLIHGAGASPRNVGDDAQAFSAGERLQRIIPDCEVVKARIYIEDDATLWPGENLVESPHLYILESSRFASVITKLFLSLRLRRLAAIQIQLSIGMRVLLLLSSAWIKARVGLGLPINSVGRRAIQSIEGVDAVYCSGGGNLNDTWLRTELIPRVVTYRLAHYLGKPVIVSGQGVGPLKSRLGRHFLTWGARHVHLFGCRDKSASERLFLSLGMGAVQVKSLGDDATDLVPAASGRARAILDSEGCPKGGTSIVAVHVRFTNFSEDFRAEGIPFVAKLCDKLIEESGCRILFIPITNAKDRAYDRDIGDGFEVYARMNYRKQAAFLCRKQYTPSEIKAVIAQADAMIAFSYHAWIFSLTSGNPTFGLYKGDYFRMKSAGIFGWYERPDWIWDIETSEPQDIAGIITKEIGGVTECREDLNTITSALVRNVAEPAHLLADLTSDR